MSAKLVNNHGSLPITWKDFNETDPDTIMFYGVVFKDNFGPFQKDIEYDHIYVSYADGIIEYRDGSGNMVSSAEFKIVPK